MIYWIIAALAAFFVKGLCGFANTLVFTSILSFGVSNSSISPVELLLGYPTNFILAWKERKSIRWEICLPLALLVVVGTIPGVLFLKSANVSSIKVLFGAIIVLIGAEMLWSDANGSRFKQSKFLLILIGILSGILCGLYGVGALLGAYLGKVTNDSHSFKANICTVFVIENTLRIVLYTVWGLLTFDVLRQAVVLLPFMLIGLGSGMLSGKFLDEKIVRKLVIVMLIVSGAALVLTNL
ncbi:MAG TPA: sulfite exporter TauE/SafE family protein [Candidatus Faecivivens stercorigallinarum]|nr:sulfite exporter TauE/SafE family protein [Candidatus Faecivivens stercorigallinarum]